MQSASGAQTVERAFQVLRLIARRGVTGMPLTEVAAGIGLPHPTAHRLLKALIHERAVFQDPATRRYKVGPAAFELSLASGFSGRSLADRYSASPQPPRTPSISSCAADSMRSASTGSRHAP